MKGITFSVLLMCVLQQNINSLKLPGPLVYVVTPSPKPPSSDEGRSAPFYYHNWIRRMDSPRNESSTSTTTEKTKTPDLIFAEFESGNNMKSIRKLLEKEQITKTTTTKSTLRPIYVPDEETDHVTRDVNYGLPAMADESKETKPTSSDPIDYFSMQNNFYNNEEVPVFVPSSTTTSTAAPTTTTTTTAPMSVENIWHIIDNQKYDQYAGKWEEEPIADENTEDVNHEDKVENHNAELEQNENEGVPLDDNFALPGFATNPGNGAENESRAIRTEPKFRFPYVNLKPFQMKDLKKPLVNSYSNSKTGSNMYNLNDFRDVKNPVRGEAQDVVPMRQPIDRYNPAQPYLPQAYGENSKQSSGNSVPGQAVASLVPPPPPPPKLTDNDFPIPSSYESFPPYTNPLPAPSPPPPSPPVKLPPPSVPKPVITMYQPPVIDSSDNSDIVQPPSDDTGPPGDVGYHYQQPPPQFLPTVPPMKKPFSGYSYNKPSITLDTPPIVSSDDKPDFSGYHYSKPEPSPPAHEHVLHDHPVPDHPSYHDHDSDYPELIYNKPHAGMSDAKGANDMKGMDMKPPPPPHDHGSPMDDGPDHGFPHDFPGDLKFNHDFDDHDFYHHHHPHTTTTTTTEQPRVNRYSYYYLGKKLYYLPLYFSVYFIIYVGALIIKAVLRHKIVYPNSWRPNDTTASFFSKRSIDSWDLSNNNIHEITGKVTHAIASAAEKYMDKKKN